MQMTKNFGMLGFSLKQSRSFQKLPTSLSSYARNSLTPLIVVKLLTAKLLGRTRQLAILDIMMQLNHYLLILLLTLWLDYLPTTTSSFSQSVGRSVGQMTESHYGGKASSSSGRFRADDSAKLAVNEINGRKANHQLTCFGCIIQPTTTDTTTIRNS